VEGIGAEEVEARLLRARPDLLGLTATSNLFSSAVGLASRLKRALPRVPIVLGGPHASNTEARILEAHECFDLLCMGEGERTLQDLLGALERGGDLREVDGLALRSEGRQVLTRPRALIEDLDEIPMPAWDLLPLHRYVPQPNDGPYLPKFSIISSRGCPYGCSFCDHGVFGTRYRSYSPSRLVDEVEHLVTAFGARDIAFVDSLFTLDAERMRGILGEMARRRVSVHWTCTVRVNVVTRAMLADMKRHGCWRVRVGVESGDQRVLDFIRKGIRLEDVRRVVRDADELGLHPKAFFMVGHPIDTEESIRASIRLACELPLTDLTVQVNTPMPGAAQSAWIERYGSLLTRDLERYSFWEPVFVPRGLTSERLRALYREFYLRLYLRPEVWRRQAGLFRSPSDLRRYARALGILGSFAIGRG
jgi:radical SAM superfamily enzyme YgiQ (UPF0313 family)